MGGSKRSLAPPGWEVKKNWKRKNAVMPGTALSETLGRVVCKNK
jgi:hypothetical protein